MVALLPLAGRLFALFVVTRALAHAFHKLQAAPTTPGLARLQTSALYILLLQLPPILFPSTGIEIIARGGAFFLCGFLGSLRWLLWCLGRWPEGGSTAGLTVSQLQGLLFLPVEGTSQRATKHIEHASLTTAGLRLGILAAVVVTLSSQDGTPSLLNTVWRHSLYSLGLYTLLTAFQDLAAMYMTGSLGLHARMHFGNPLVSDRLTIFWAKKWNLPVQSILRSLVYDPITQGRLTKPEAPSVQLKLPLTVSWARRFAAVCAVFLLSGVIHEAAFCYLTGAPSPQLRWMWFFAAQGPLCILETAIFPRTPVVGVSPWARARTTAHIIATAAVLEALAGPLFWKPTEESGLPSAIVHDAVSSFGIGYTFT